MYGVVVDYVPTTSKGWISTWSGNYVLMLLCTPMIQKTESGKYYSSIVNNLYKIDELQWKIELKNIDSSKLIDSWRRTFSLYRPKSFEFIRKFKRISDTAIEIETRYQINDLNNYLIDPVFSIDYSIPTIENYLDFYLVKNTINNRSIVVSKNIDYYKMDRKEWLVAGVPNKLDDDLILLNTGILFLVKLPKFFNQNQILKILNYIKLKSSSLSLLDNKFDILFDFNQIIKSTELDTINIDKININFTPYWPNREIAELVAEYINVHFGSQSDFIVRSFQDGYSRQDTEKSHIRLSLILAQSNTPIHITRSLINSNIIEQEEKMRHFENKLRIIESQTNSDIWGSEIQNINLEITKFTRSGFIGFYQGYYSKNHTNQIDINGFYIKKGEDNELFVN